MNILDRIVAQKRQTLAAQQAAVPVSVLERSPYFERDPYSLRAALLHPQELGIIAEFKRHSPSQGDLNTTASPAVVPAGYLASGASAVSILTDAPFFKGQNADVEAARPTHHSPILRKDFIVSEYQILEAKAIGADAILLIAECLTAREVAELAAFAERLGLDVLLEIHSADQLAKLSPAVTVVGVNNRNLKTMAVDVRTSLDLLEQIPRDFVRISESGISAPETIVTLRQAGFQGFLIGEAFMKTPDPVAACAAFTAAVHQRLRP